jgi:hypothetical protein
MSPAPDTGIKPASGLSSLGTFGRLAAELRQQIFEDVEPEDLRSLCLTCRDFNQLIKNNRGVCRGVYLNYLVRQPGPKYARGNANDVEG